MKLKSELVIGNVYFPGKAWLNPSILNCFGSLMFPMNLINTPGLWNVGSGGVNGASLCDTKSMPSFMGSSAQASRYARSLVTGSSISISIKVMQETFTYDPTLTRYIGNEPQSVYFCLVPFNSEWKTNGTVNSLNYMPWAQAIRQPGARRMRLSGMQGKCSGTLRAYTAIGKIEGTPSWETDGSYRCASAGSSWSTPDRNPMWMLMAYMPGTGTTFTDISPGFEFSVSMTAHTTFFMPKIATLYTSLDPTETKVIVSESDPHSDDDCKLEDDDDPSLLDMTAFTVTEPPPLVRTTTQGRIMPTGAAGPRRPVPGPPKPGGAPRSGGGEAPPPKAATPMSPRV